MITTLRTNIPALVAIAQLQDLNKQIAQTNERITTGLRINHSSDDPAGFAISTRMKARLDGVEQASRNVQNGVSALQIADSAMIQIQDSLKKIKAYALQASDAMLTTSDRQAIQVSVNQLLQEVDRIASTATFNGKKLLDGSFLNMSLQIGPDAGNTFGVTLTSISAGGLGITSLSVSTLASAQGAITTVQNAINSAATKQADTGSYLTRLNNIDVALKVQRENETAALGSLQDADPAEEVVRLAQLQLRQSAAGQAISIAMMNQQTVMQLLMG